jgi:hypothetical protein
MNDKMIAKLLAKTTCPDCVVVPGAQHEEGCDVARCPLCGQQDLGCTEQVGEDDPTSPMVCGNTGQERTPGDMTVWTGVWPGVEECIEFGWWGRWTVATEHSADGVPDSGEFVSCDAEHPHAQPDLTRLNIAGQLGELRWDRERNRWVR